MKIGLNATCFNNRPSGANQRFIGIYSEVVKLLPDVEFVVYEPTDCHVGSWFNDAPNVSVRKTPIPSEGRIKKMIKGFGYWQSALKDENFDIFEGFNLPLVKPARGKRVFTLHDVRRMHAGGKSIFDRLSFRALLSKTLGLTDRLITVSESMKKEILSFYPETSISVVYNGVNIEAYQQVTEEEEQQFSIKYKLPSEFLLAVGHFEKRKNYLNLIEAVAHLQEKGRGAHLLIVGNDSGEGQVMREKIKDMNLTDHVTILSGLSDLEVRCAYRLCNLFVFPSSYEGFGIPILEAMAAGSPMVLSDIPVFREITEDQGIYFAHDDPKLIANAIDKVLLSSAERSHLVHYGQKRVQDFGFKKIATDLANLYRSLL